MSEAAVRCDFDPFIVAEVSKNWPEQDDELGMPRLLSQRFERVINVNWSRGYKLQSWQLNRLVSQDAINETIVAVFARYVAS